MSDEVKSVTIRICQPGDTPNIRIEKADDLIAMHELRRCLGLLGFVPACKIENVAFLMSCVLSDLENREHAIARERAEEVYRSLDIYVDATRKGGL